MPNTEMQVFYVFKCLNLEDVVIQSYLKMWAKIYAKSTHTKLCKKNSAVAENVKEEKGFCFPGAHQAPK